MIDEVLDIVETVEWKNKDYNDSTKDFFILSRYSELSKKFDDKVNTCLSELGYVIPFKMSSSWLGEEARLVQPWRSQIGRAHV